MLIGPYNALAVVIPKDDLDFEEFDPADIIIFVLLALRRLRSLGPFYRDAAHISLKVRLNYFSQLIRNMSKIIVYK